MTLEEMDLMTEPPWSMVWTTSPPIGVTVVAIAAAAWTRTEPSGAPRDAAARACRRRPR